MAIDTYKTQWGGCPSTCEKFNNQAGIQAIVDNASAGGDPRIAEMLDAARSNSPKAVPLLKGIHTDSSKQLVEEGHFTLAWNGGFHFYICPKLGGQWIANRITYGNKVD